MSEDFAIALAKIRPHTTSKQDHQRKPAQLLVALEATLQENTGSSPQNPTAYFAALITTLEGCIGKDDLNLEDGATLPAVLYLLALVLPFVPDPVIRSHVSQVFQLIPPLLPLATPTHAPSLRSIITILGTAITSLDQGQVLSTVSTSSAFPLAFSYSATATAIRQTFSSLLELVIDPRPKVRKRAAESIKTILETPPSPLAFHPWSNFVADWSCNVVAQAAETGVVLSAGKKGGSNERVEQLIHLLAFLRTVPLIFSASVIGEARGEEEGSTVEVMTRYLLAMPKLSNPYLTQASYQLLTVLLSPEDEDEEDDEDIWLQRRRDQARRVLKTLLSNTPPKTDAQIAPYWLAAVAHASVSSKLSSGTSSATAVDIGNIWQILWSFLDSTCTLDTRNSAKDALTLILNNGCLPTDEMRGMTNAGCGIMNAILELIVKSIPHIAFASSVKEILDISASLAEASSPLHISSMPIDDPERLHSTMKKNHPLIPLLDITVALRNTKGFDHKDSVDKFLGAMMRAVGVDGVLERLPLGLLPSERSNLGGQPNAYLLPLIPAHHPTPLAHFVNHFIPLSEQLWEHIEKSEKEAERKVYRVLMEQIWATFPSYCWGCWDLQQTFTPKLAERLTQVLYHEPALRGSILRGLRILVETNVNILKIQTMEDYTSESGSEEEDGTKLDTEDSVSGYRPRHILEQQGSDTWLITEDMARLNIEYLNKQAKSWLAVLFNVFTGMEKDSRSLVSDTISAWASIANEPELASAYRNVLSHLNRNLTVVPEMKTKVTQGSAPPREIKMVNQMLDILLLLVPYLPTIQLKEVISLVLEKKVLGHPDSGVQKLGYRVLGRATVQLSENDEIHDGERTVIVERVLTEAGSGIDVAPGSMKERLSFLTLVIPYLHPASLHLLVSHLMEAIMGVKEHSEKARKSAFELLVVMGHKMAGGGSIRMDLVNGAGDESDKGVMEREANLEEFVKMVGASLAADRDHTISAGIMSLSRVLFEFKETLSEEIQTEIVTTIYPLLGVKNREVVKSVLGFVKLSIHSLPSSAVQLELPNLVPSLLACLAAHRHHFKVKIRHIFERLLRKFGADEIEKYASSGTAEYEGGLKMLLNIKKRKERAARKKWNAVAHDGDQNEENLPRKSTTGDAFDDVLYGSESEIDDSDGETDVRKAGETVASKRSGKRNERGKISTDTRLKLDDDEPMDLLAGTTGKLTASTKPKSRRPGQEASKFKTDESTGKMVIMESDSDSDHLSNSKTPKAASGDAIAGAAYKGNLISVDGFTRNPNGTIKFHKDTKKRRREEMEMEGDVEMEDVTTQAKAGGVARKAKKRKEVRLGHEFKAKKAGGDVKKNGVDPYAYLTLGQAAGGRRGRGKPKVTILGK